MFERKRIETKRAKELETIMESKKFSQIFSDVAFILADPFVVDMLARNVMSLVNRCVQNELLPRVCILNFLTIDYFDGNLIWISYHRIVQNSFLCYGYSQLVC